MTDRPGQCTNHAYRATLERDEASIAEIAGRLGYESESAFSRSFKRVIGTSPGAVRRRHRQSAIAMRA